MKGCRALTDDEVARVSEGLLGTYAARDRALFVLGVKTGFQISELLSLRVGDVWQHGQFMGWVAVSRRYMKGKTEGRSAILHAEAKTALAAWLMAMQRMGTVSPETYLFPDRQSGGGGVQRLDVLVERVIALQGHAGPTAQAVGVVERHLCTCDDGDRSAVRGLACNWGW